MKKLILLALLAVIMVGCRYKQTSWNVREASNPIIVVDSRSGDSCEYFPYYGHNGICRFCKERDSIKWEKRKAEIVELLKRETID